MHHSSNGGGARGLSETAEKSDVAKKRDNAESCAKIDFSTSKSVWTIISTQGSSRRRLIAAVPTHSMTRHAVSLHKLPELTLTSREVPTKDEALAWMGPKGFD
jgi:hypothetical protein